jgi:hypothetical protein
MEENGEQQAEDADSVDFAIVKGGSRDASHTPSSAALLRSVSVRLTLSSSIAAPADAGRPPSHYHLRRYISP